MLDAERRPAPHRLDQLGRRGCARDRCSSPRARRRQPATYGTRSSPAARCFARSPPARGDVVGVTLPTARRWTGDALFPADWMRSCTSCHSGYCAFSEGVELHMVPREDEVFSIPPSPGGSTGAWLEDAMAVEGSPRPPLQDLERRYIARVLQESHGNQRRAARILGISRWSLSRRLRRYGIASRPAA